MDSIKPPPKIIYEKKIKMLQKNNIDKKGYKKYTLYE